MPAGTTRARGHVLWVLVLLLASLGAACSGGKDGSAGGGLLLSRVSVSVVPGGAEEIRVLQMEGRSAEGTFTAESSDEAVATATVSGAEITISGVGLGVCTVTVRSAEGPWQRIPVQVYDHHVLDTGELLVTFTDRFERIVDLPQVVYNDAELLIREEQFVASVWRPVPPEGFVALGSFMVRSIADPSGQEAVMVVRAKPGSDALVLTTEYDPVYQLVYSSKKGTRFLRPRCPDGYRALGDVASYGTTIPWPYPTPCVRQDLTVLGAAESNIHTTSGQEVLSFWNVDLPNAGPHDGTHLAPGTFVLAQGTAAPSFDLAQNVLRVELPMLAEAPPQTFIPKLTDIVRPPLETPPLFAKAMLVPCTMTRDALHVDLPWRVANSPFYRLERHVFYKMLAFRYNEGSVLLPGSVVIRSGVTTEERNAFHTSTNVAISYEAGVQLGDFLSGKVTSTVSREFGYETQTAVTALSEKEVSTSFDTPPGKASVVWQEYNRYVLYRHVGTMLEPVAAWEFGMDSFVTDDHPD